MKAVVPGIDEQYSLGVSYYYNPEYPFNQYVSLFIHDLNKSSKRKYGKNRFDQLSLTERQTLIAERCGDFLMKNLFLGAIWFTGLIVYTGMAHPENKSIPLNFDGPYNKQNYTYPNPRDFLGDCMTLDGNLT